MIEYTNSVLGTNQAFICNSRPRRFGKSITADMLVAYYSRGCDSESLFSATKIAQSEDYKKHLNKYDVIRLDIQWFLSSAKPVENIVGRIEDSVLKELREEYPQELQEEELSLAEALSILHVKTKKQFVVIIDEWDVLIRDESLNTQVQEKYIDFLRSMFKGSHPSEFIYLAYMTGILPIKRMKTQSALNNFDEFTMLAPAKLAPYIGFTEKEVMELCEQYQMDFEKVKRWYDGYVLGGEHVYNPKAVVSVMLRGEYQSYWSKTGTYESILPLINMDFDGLRTAIIEMLSGASVEVDTNSFQNDMVSFRNKDDVLTLLIHLGYLAYNRNRGTAFIPNEEIRQEFLVATKSNEWNELIDFRENRKICWMRRLIWTATR